MESVPYIFDTNSVKKLLANKLVVFIGDSGKRFCCHEFWSFSLINLFIYYVMNILVYNSLLLNTVTRV